MAKEKEYDALSEQIGDLGGEPAAEQGLGKLKHKSSYGQKEDLTNDEEKEKEAFLNRQRDARVAREESYAKSNDEDTLIAEGWIPVNKKDFKERAPFYPESWQFYVRPATVGAIKNWISIDEDNLIQLQKVFNEIIKLSVRVMDGQTIVPWSNINSWDRFWLTSKIREATFASNKKTITFEDECSECGEEITFELRSDNLHFEFPDEELIEKYWTGSVWEIDPAEYDIDHEPITLYTPTLGKDDAILNWAMRENERKKKIDETFVKFAVWMFNKPAKDNDMFDKQMKKLYNEYKSWDISFFKFMDQVIKNITVDPKETLKQTCPHCGEEVISNVKFPNGIKALFDVETTGKKFGTR